MHGTLWSGGKDVFLGSFFKVNIGSPTINSLSSHIQFFF